MNERIRELAEQAKDHANTYDDVGTPIWFQMYNEKFAELIIQECLELARSYPGQNEDYAAGIDSVRDSIKQHFGIKE